VGAERDEVIPIMDAIELSGNGVKTKRAVAQIIVAYILLISDIRVALAVTEGAVP
jgi:hypothetical protein